MPQDNDQNDDIVLSELADDELTEQMFDDLYDGLAEEIAEGTQILLDRGWDAKKVLDEVLVGGAPLNEEFGKAVGADAYCRDAATAVQIAKQLVQEQRAS